MNNSTTKNSTFSLRGAIYGIVAASIWGGMYVVSDAVLPVIPSFTLLTMRLALGGAALAGIVIMSKQPLLVPRPAMIRLLLLGILASGISLGLQFVGTSLSNAANGSVITSASPAFIVFFAWLLLKEPLNLLKIAAVVLASIGVMIVLDLSKLDLSSTLLQGNLALVFAALTWGLYSVLVRQLSTQYPSLTITFYAVIGGLIVSIPVMILELASKPLTGVTFNIVLGVLYLGLFSTALALFLWNRAFALVEASIASLFFFAQPLVGVLLSSLLLGQALTPQLLLGGALILIGVLISMRAGNNDAQNATQIEASKA